MPSPFVKHKEVSVSVPNDIIKRDSDEESEYDSMEAAAEDLCHAISAKDYKAIAEALRAAFELMDSGPHEEGPHE